MRKTAAFWDASALAPLCIHEAASQQAQRYIRKFAPVVWWGSLVEVHSAICRLYREQEIGEADKRGALARLHLLSRAWREVLPGEEVRSLATELPDRYSLRAADSLQLAAALLWCGQHPSEAGFVCGDRKLAAAASAAGFSVVEFSSPDR